MSIDLPSEHELRLAWLAILDENLHCLQGAKMLWISIWGPLETDVAAMIDKFKTLVQVIVSRYRQMPE